MVDDPRTTVPSEPDRRLLAEADRDEPILASAPVEDAAEREDALDEQILAGLVTP
jgi:hypothetical protein